MMTLVNSNVTQLQLFYGDDFVVNEHITLHQPTIGEILEYDKQYGESSFWSMLNVFTANPTSYRLFLWKDMNIDWTFLNDYQLFLILYRTLSIEQTRLIFGDLDFSKFEIFTLPEEEWTNIDEKGITDVIKLLRNSTLYNPEEEFELDENSFNVIVYYLRSAFSMFPKIEKAKDRTTKEWIAELEAAGVPCAPINNVAQVMEDPSIIARNMIVEVEHPVAGKLKVPGIPIKLSETPGEILTPAPLLAADTNEIMKEFFGWDEATTKAKLGE